RGSFLAGASRKQHDGYPGDVFPRSDRVQQLKAIHPRHHDVRDDEIRSVLLDALERLYAVGSGFNLPALTQEPAEIAPHIGVVVHDQDSSYGGITCYHDR